MCNELVDPATHPNQFIDRIMRGGPSKAEPGHIADKSHSLVHVGTLIYGSIVYHRHRISKADERRNSIHHHDARHSQLDTIEYQTLDSPLTSEQQSNSNSLVGRRVPVERERDGTEFHRLMQIPWMQDLRGGRGEVHELATTRSVRSLEVEGGGIEESPIGG